MQDDKKDFFNIAKMTDTYRTAQLIGGELEPNGIDAIAQWQLHFNLAIAQQLTVISGHLARISETLDVALDRAKNSEWKNKS